MKSKRVVIVAVCISFIFTQFLFAVSVRIKDIAVIRGIRENQLIGYGLVVGLNGRGDSSRSDLTKQIVKTFLKNLGININKDSLLLSNSAVVVVTANFRPFSREGDRIDITVSSLADARSLSGGVLLQTPLKAADGNVYAVGQGQVLVGGTADTTLNVGRIPKGALVERGVVSKFFDNNIVRIAIKDRDFTTINNINKAIIKKFSKIVTKIEDPATIAVTIPDNYKANPVGFIAELEILEVEADTPAKVVVDGKSGTVVIGEKVKISTVAVSYNGIKISIGLTGNSKGTSFVLSGGASVKALVDGLNKIGARASDVINILQAIEKSGALKAKLIIM